MSALNDQVMELMKNQNHMLEAIKYLDERIKDIIGQAKDDKFNQVDNILESQAMIDEIVVKNSDAIIVLKKRKEDNAAAIKRLDTKIDNIDKEMEKTKKLIHEKQDMVKKSKSDSDNLMTCNLCDERFKRFVELEKHIKYCHEEHQLFQCDICTKSFTLEWRLKKHSNLHTKNDVQPCHYFNNEKECPFEEFGCKFQHVMSKNCQYGQTCQKRLCPYRHSKEESNDMIDARDTMIENYENESEMEETDYTNEKESFLTSTPQKRKFECKECLNQSQCTDCFVRQVMEKSHRVHFSE